MGQRRQTGKDGGSHGAVSPYPASWIDRLVRRIDRQAVPGWLVYAALLPLIALLNNAVFWLDGSLPAGTLDRVRSTDAVYTLFFFALYHHLSLVAGNSFRGFQSLLRGTKSDLPTAEYSLTVLPRSQGWWAIGLGTALAIASIQSDAAAFGLDDARTALPMAYQYAVTSLAFSSVFAVMIQTTRQMRLVTQLHQQATNINLFQLAPVHAMASLSAWAGIGLALFMLFNAVAESSNITELNLAFLAVMAILAGSVFLVPLLGMRKRLGSEKARLASETNEAIQLTIGRIHGRVKADKVKDVSELNAVLSALVVERGLIERISTWPWEASTLRGVASSVLLPILFLLVTRLLERLI